MRPLHAPRPCEFVTVDLLDKNAPVALRFVAHGLLAGRQEIDDTQACGSQRDAGIVVIAHLIRPPVPNGGQHPLDSLRNTIDKLIGMVEANDSAHLLCTISN